MSHANHDALLREGAAPSAPTLVFAAPTEHCPPGFLERVEVNAFHS